MAIMPYTKVFPDMLDEIECFSMAERGRILTLMLEYLRDGITSPLTGNERFFFPVIKGRMDREADQYAKTCERNRGNGVKGGRPRQQGNPENPVGFSETQKTQVVFPETQKTQNKDGNKDEDGNKDWNKDGDEDGYARASASAYASQTLLNLSGGNLEELADFAQHIPDDIIRWAVDESAAAGKPYWTYCRAILRKCIERGYKTLAEIKAAESSRKKGGVVGGIGADDYKPIPGGINL